MLRDQRGNSFSRKDLTLGLAHQDGGVHIDKAIKGSYAELTRDNSLGFQQGDGQPIANSVVNTSVRQIAWELAQTLDAISWMAKRRGWHSRCAPLPTPPRSRQAGMIRVLAEAAGS